jgi:hypothetical protein
MYAAESVIKFQVSHFRVDVPGYRARTVFEGYSNVSAHISKTPSLTLVVWNNVPKCMVYNELTKSCPSSSIEYFARKLG